MGIHRSDLTVGVTAEAGTVDASETIKCLFLYTAPGFMLPLRSVDFQVQFYVMSYAQLTKRDSSDSNI
jgi:hypothetical protein